MATLGPTTACQLICSCRRVNNYSRLGKKLLSPVYFYLYCTCTEVVQFPWTVQGNKLKKLLMSVIGV